MDFFWRVNWEKLFVPELSILEIVIRGTCIYFGLCLLLRMVLKRQAGKVSLSDLLVVSLVAGVCRNPLVADAYSITDGLLVVATVLGWSFLLDFLSYWLPFVHRLVHSPPKLLVQDGRVQSENLRRELMTQNQLLSKLRRKGFRSPEEVAEAWLEGDGHVSVIAKDGNGSASENHPASSMPPTSCPEQSAVAPQSVGFAKLDVVALDKHPIIVAGPSPCNWTDHTAGRRLLVHARAAAPRAENGMTPSRIDQPFSVRALACDGDGTLMRGSKMAQSTAEALARWKEEGGKLILTTGEREEEVAKFPHLELFDLVVAENGAMLFCPETKAVTLLVAARPVAFSHALGQRQVKVKSLGRVIVSVERKEESSLRAIIHDLALDWRIVANRKQIMALPCGVDKASGLRHALKELKLSAQDVVGIGDAENDEVLLDCCGYGAAVHSAVTSLKKHAHFVTQGGAGKGVVELIRLILAGRNFPIRHR